MQVHYEGIHRIDPVSGERGEVVDEIQEAVVQCLDCMHDQPHLAFQNGRIEPIEDRWERMVAGTPWVASCTVTVDADAVETCSGPEAADALAYAAFGDHGTREFFTHVRFHKHDEDQIVVHLLVELYARSSDEATTVLEEAARGRAHDHVAGRGVPPARGDRRRAPALRHGARGAARRAPGARAGGGAAAAGDRARADPRAGRDLRGRRLRLQGSGKVHRHVRVADAAAADDPALRDLMARAAAARLS